MSPIFVQTGWTEIPTIITDGAAVLEAVAAGLFAQVTAAEKMEVRHSP